MGVTDQTLGEEALQARPRVVEGRVQGLVEREQLLILGGPLGWSFRPAGPLC